jgi:hypothetical protein
MRCSSAVCRRMVTGAPASRSRRLVVLAHQEQFDRLRAFLLKQAPAAYVGASRMRSYGSLTVGQVAPAVLDQKYRAPGPKTRTV